LFQNTCKSLLFYSTGVLQVHCCLGALSSNRRQPQTCTALVKATQQLFGPYWLLCTNSEVGSAGFEPATRGYEEPYSAALALKQVTNYPFINYQVLFED